MTRVQTWRALAAGEPLTLTPAEAAELLSVLRASVLDGLCVRDCWPQRRILAATPGAPALWSGAA